MTILFTGILILYTFGVEVVLESKEEYKTEAECKQFIQDTIKDIQKRPVYKDIEKIKAGCLAKTIKYI